MPGKVERSFGRRLRKLREARRLTQAELGERCGISAKYLGIVERGEQSPTLNVLDRLSAGLGVELDELVQLRGEPDPKQIRFELAAIIRAATDDEARRLLQLAKISIRPVPQEHRARSRD